MGDGSGVPELRNHAAAGGVNGIGDATPSADLLLGPQAGRIGPAKSFRANRRGFRDDQSGRSTLRVIFGLQRSGHLIMRLRAHPGERRHDDAVRKIEVSHSISCEQWLIRLRIQCAPEVSDYSFEPPSTGILAPVIQRAWSVARNAITSATSSGLPMRFSACMPSVISRPASVLVKF